MPRILLREDGGALLREDGGYILLEYQPVVIPSAIAQEATNITSNSARIWGKVTDDGGEPVEARFRWQFCHRHCLKSRLDKVEEGVTKLKEAKGTLK